MTVFSSTKIFMYVQSFLTLRNFALRTFIAHRIPSACHPNAKPLIRTKTSTETNVTFALTLWSGVQILVFLQYILLSFL
jgi:hypothetical protein